MSAILSVRTQPVLRCLSTRYIQKNLASSIQSQFRFYASSKFPEHTIINMPALSPTMTEGNLIKWHKSIGDKLSPGESIAEVETDKASMDFEFQEDGYLAKILVNDGTNNIPVNKPIAVYVEEKSDVAAFESFTAADAGDEISSSSTSTSSSNEASTQTEPSKKETATISSSNPNSNPVSIKTSISTDRIIASPFAKKIALEKGISLKGIQGTGPNGRITAKDVENIKSNEIKSSEPISTSTSTTSTTSTSTSYIDIPLTNMRKVISKRLTSSKQSAPDYIISSTISVSKLLKLRKSLNSTSNGEFKLTINDLLVKAISKAALRVPESNSYYLENEEIIRQFNNVDISIAVSTPTGLITPIVKNSDIKGLKSISNEIKILGKKAKENKLKPEEFQGGTITISNLGMNNAVSMFTSILNPPQSVILAIGTVEKRAVPDKANEFGFIFDDVMTITGTFDHRTIDGAKGGDFMRELKTIIENPLEMLL
jgi:pyruvate dehydrogenase E2 component (dihydrolipoamide acetyltransferase)